MIRKMKEEDKCGFQIVSTEKVGDVELARFVAER